MTKYGRIHRYIYRDIIGPYVKQTWDNFSKVGTWANSFGPNFDRTIALECTQLPMLINRPLHQCYQFTGHFPQLQDTVVQWRKFIILAEITWKSRYKCFFVLRKLTHRDW
jgi:hypothetical protein